MGKKLKKLVCILTSLVGRDLLSLCGVSKDRIVDLYPFRMPRLSYYYYVAHCTDDHLTDQKLPLPSLNREVPTADLEKGGGREKKNSAPGEKKDWTQLAQ